MEKNNFMRNYPCNLWQKKYAAIFEKLNNKSGKAK
jgi:hypothetical protein